MEQTDYSRSHCHIWVNRILTKLWTINTIRFKAIWAKNIKDSRDFKHWNKAQMNLGTEQLFHNILERLAEEDWYQMREYTFRKVRRVHWINHMDLTKIRRYQPIRDWRVPFCLVKQTIWQEFQNRDSRTLRIKMEQLLPIPPRWTHLIIIKQQQIKAKLTAS